MISIHSPHTRGDPEYKLKSRPKIGISIHSPHTRGDGLFNRVGIDISISIHSPHTRGDGGFPRSPPPMRPFQSTPLIRGETSPAICSISRPQISIHSPHTRGDPRSLPPQLINSNFNPLPSYEGRLARVVVCRCLWQFQSTPLIRGETAARQYSVCAGSISIHSPHTRGDIFCSFACTVAQNFNPLPSYEGRHRLVWRRRRGKGISIHSPHTRGD